MKKYPFELESDESLILVKSNVNGERAALALDTGASHTTLDLSFLLITGVEMQDSLDTVLLETAIGPVEAYVFKVNLFTALGITVRDFHVCAYDFLANNIFSDFDGMLGLDFFRGHDLHISFKRFEIIVE